LYQKTHDIAATGFVENTKGPRALSTPRSYAEEAGSGVVVVVVVVVVVARAHDIFELLDLLLLAITARFT
jgi:hypothetical protein